MHARVLPGRVDETVVSVVLEGYEYLGGASGNGLTDGWVFSTATGEEAESELRAGEVPMERWSLHDGSLHVHFPPYELAPGAAGPLTAELDLTAVRAATGTPLGGGT